VLVKNTDNNVGRIVKAVLFGHPFKFCSRAEEIDATARSGSDLYLHLDLLPCPQEPKYALHLRVSVVRIPDCLNSSFGGSEYQDMRLTAHDVLRDIPVPLLRRLVSSSYRRCSLSQKS
ncbi:hypothetical protein ACJX0J_012729, partial [Zea mays]